MQVDICGHATLAAAHFLFAYGLVKTDTIEFSSRAGILTAKKVPESKTSNSQDNSPIGYLIELDFPVVQVTETNFTDVSAISKSLNGASVVEIHETLMGDHFVRIYLFFTFMLHQYASFIYKFLWNKKKISLNLMSMGW